MARVFVTGSSDGLGLMAARRLIEQGHEVVLHGRNEARSRDALAAAAGRPGSRFRGPLDHRRRESGRRPGQPARPLRCGHPQCGHRLSRDAARGDRARGSQRLRGQCARTLRSDGADRETGPAGLCQLRDAPRGAAAYRRPALDQACLERLVGICGEQAVRCSARICRRSAVEERPIQRAGAGSCGQFRDRGEPGRATIRRRGKGDGARFHHVIVGRPWSHRGQAPRFRNSPDSPLEGDGFEPRSRAAGTMLFEIWTSSPPPRARSRGLADDRAACQPAS
jgi:hypothetical protein